MLEEQAKGDETAVVVRDDVGCGGQVPGRNQCGAGGGAEGEGGVEVLERVRGICGCVRGCGDGEATWRGRGPEARVVVEEDGVAG